MARARCRWLRHIGVVAILSLGCGSPPASPDGGQHEEDAAVPPDAGRDAGADRVAPLVTSTRPRNGQDLVARTAELEVRFSERVTQSSGTVTATSGGASVALGARVWEPEGDVLRIGAEGGWPGGARVDVRVEGFTDPAGNTQETAYELVFHTSDDGEPVVVETTPAEGASDVGVDLVAIVVRFSEPMNDVLGTLTLEGGAGALGAGSWASSTELRAPVSGLERGASYRVVLSGFEDRSGNPLDGAPVLGDGAIDFMTAPDTTPPAIVDSNPTHGQLDVDVSALPAIEVTFDEPMDTSERTATLRAATSTTTLTGNWSPDATVLTFAVVGRLTIDAEHRLDLSGMRDAAGNALDGSVGLDDGELLFTTSSADDSVPFVVFTTPTEGATDVSTRTEELTIQFSEAMDVSVTEIELASAGDTRTLAGTWNTAGTRLTAPLGAGLAARTDYTIDLRGLEDATGNPLDAAHPYLVDGVLGFRTGSPTGENCADPLTVAEAVSDATGHTWDLPGGSFRVADGAFSCSTTNALSGVIVYEKTTADLAGGGRALRVTTTNNDALDGISIEVFRSVCDRSAPGGGLAAREVCVGQRPYWSQYLDVPAGTYFLWVNTGSATEFAGGSLRIEEVSAIPRGESCDAPFDTSAPGYSSPAADTHEWLIEHAPSSQWSMATRRRGTAPSRARAARARTASCASRRPARAASWTSRSIRSPPRRARTSSITPVSSRRSSRRATRGWRPRPRSRAPAASTTRAASR